MSDHNPPVPVGPLAAKYGQVYRVPKRCRTCGLTWEGNSFSPSLEGGVRSSMCGPCVQAEDARLLASAPKRAVEPEVTDLVPPREPGE